MNSIAILSSQPWVERLGWTLLHFLWQGLLCAAVYAGTRRWMARSTPNARYLAACLTMAAMLATPLATFLCLGPPPELAPPPDATARALHLPPRPVGVAVFLPSFALNRPAGARISQAAPWIVTIWLLGAAVFLLRLAGGWWMTARMRSRHIRQAPPEWQQTVARLCARMSLTRPVRLLVSVRLDVPIVVGWIRPVVLVPLGALASLPPEHIEALLLHELAHIRRHDYLVNVLQSVAEALLFYHPAVWWVSGHIRTEREVCCDDLAVGATGDAVTYAIALTTLEACRPAHAQGALAANGGRLTSRIARLLGQAPPESRTFSNPGVAAIYVLLAMGACALFAQSADRPKFEVASVKPIPESRNISGIKPIVGGRLLAENCTVRQLVMYAYQLRDFQVVGGAEWLRDQGFDVEAKGDPNATRESFMLMLQSLLEDRFQLKYHRETRELPVYALAVAKSGPKLPAPKEGGCVKPDAAVSLSPGQLPCGSVNVRMSSSGLNAHGGEVPMAELVRQLASILGRPVLDRTGITANFDLSLQFALDDTVEGMMKQWGNVQGHRESMMAAASGAGDPQALPNILAAVQEQLGLKLTATKGPVEVIVIDHVEKPSVN
jgi:uncharacterized protein (TIGR03435 family)